MQNQSSSDRNRDKKREQFVGEAQPKSKAVPVMVALLLGLAAVAVLLIVRSSSDKPEATTITSAGATKEPVSPAAANNQQASATDTVKIPLADLSGQAKFFDYPAGNGKQVRFFVVKSADGKCRAALDACEVCFHAKKGYRQDGDKMICSNCGLSFEIARIGTVQGGCHPVGVGGTVEGDQLVIKASDLQSGIKYF
jgi:uncharacterized membrane protein